MSSLSIEPSCTPDGPIGINALDKTVEPPRRIIAQIPIAAASYAVSCRTTEAPQYLQPGIEKFLELSTAQAAQPLDTSQFAPKVAGLGTLQQQAQQQAATQAGLGTLQFDPTSGAVSGVQGTGVAGFQPFLTDAQTTLGGVSPMITAAASRQPKAEVRWGPMTLPRLTPHRSEFLGQ